MRKIVQIAVTPESERFKPMLVALCDDGALFVTSPTSSADIPETWFTIAPIPQPVGTDQ